MAPTLGMVATARRGKDWRPWSSRVDHEDQHNTGNFVGQQ